MASSSASTDSAAFSSAISSSRLLGPVIPIGTPFREVGATLEHFKAAERILGAVAVHDLARAGASDGALEPGLDRVLASAGLAELALELGDVRLVALQGLVDDFDLIPQAFAHVGSFLALDQRGFREILPAFAQC